MLRLDGSIECELKAFQTTRDESMRVINFFFANLGRRGRRGDGGSRQISPRQGFITVMHLFGAES